MTAPFAILEDYIEAFGYVSSPDGDTDMQVRAALAAACEGIRRYCSQTFTLVEDDVVVLHGTGSAIVTLPELPVVDVNTVTLNAGEDSEEEITDYRFDSASGELYRKSTDWCWRVWPAGFLNITVDYDHGWTTVPRELVRIACLMAKNQITTKQVGLAGESIGGYSYTSDPVYSIALAEESTRQRLQKALDWYRLPRVPVA